jgi:hypothetical protein
MHGRVKFLGFGVATFLLTSCTYRVEKIGGDQPMQTSEAVVAVKSVEFEVVRATNLADIGRVQNEYSKPELEKALRVFSQTLFNRDPRSEEMTQLTSGVDGYSRVIEAMLKSGEFNDGLRSYFRNVFQMTGVENGVNLDEPSNLAVYLATNDLDFRRILTETECYDNSLRAIQCTSFSTALDVKKLGAGVLTTRAFLSKWASAFNFRRVSRAFSLFACSEYPDGRDQGLTPAEISDKIKPFNSLTQNPVCYNCHRNMNPRAALFYQFDRKGIFNLNPNPSVAAGEISLTDTGAASTVDDVLKPGVKPKYNGKLVANLREYALEFSKSQAFRDCLAQRLVNLMMGRSASQRVSAEMQDVRDNVEYNEFKIRRILHEIALHPGFVRR